MATKGKAKTAIIEDEEIDDEDLDDAEDLPVESGNGVADLDGLDLEDDDDDEQGEPVKKRRITAKKKAATKAKKSVALKAAGDRRRRTISHTIPKVGASFTATYKGRQHTMRVVAGKDGSVVYTVGGRRFTSPSSAAGSVVDAPNAPNGWSFWGMDGAGPKRSMKKAPAKIAKKAALKRTAKKVAPKRAAKKSASKRKGGRRGR